MFHGPNAYISPSWYASKREHGRVVPTWNYTAVHAYGRLHVVEDAEWLRSHLEDMTQRLEVNIPEPWAIVRRASGVCRVVAGAPCRY